MKIARSHLFEPGHLPPHFGNKRGLSLVELLVVIAIVGIMALSVFTGIQGLGGAESFRSSIYGLTNIFNQARSIAIANHTYVFVGITEVDGSQLESTIPQKTGTGRVAVVVMQSVNGLRNYDSGNWLPASSTTGLTPVFPVTVFSNLHLIDLSNLIPTSGGMVRSKVESQYSLTNANAPITTYTFNWPLLSTTATAKYSFSQIIQFNPIGQSIFVPTAYSPNNDGIISVLEIGLQPTHGNLVPPFPTQVVTGNIAVIQIAGESGGVTLYQP